MTLLPRRAVEVLRGRPEAERHLFFRPLLSSAISPPPSLLDPRHSSAFAKCLRCLLIYGFALALSPFEPRFLSSLHCSRSPHVLFRFFLLFVFALFSSWVAFFSLFQTRRIISSFTPPPPLLISPHRVFKPSFPTCSFSLFRRVVPPLMWPRVSPPGTRQTHNIPPFSTGRRGLKIERNRQVSDAKEAECEGATRTGLTTLHVGTTRSELEASWRSSWK